MILFYTQNIEASTATLSEEESNHCLKVLRKKMGDIVHFTDGKGKLYQAKIINNHPKQCQLQIIDVLTDLPRRAFHLHLAIAPTKNIERMEWLLEKLVEIGIDEISFLHCEHSERKQLNISRLEKIAQSAMKQSLNLHLPIIQPLQKYGNFINAITAQQKFIAYLPETTPTLLKHQFEPATGYCLLIGPEGDFSPQEVKMALTKGFVPVSLGSARLRTETAGLVACHTIHLLYQ
ncbi:MAG: 16S rRNA (uracil(1498)-N(3))-methyltransferase [Microscillaceae bacterium]|jgi:16S rRNA (uracil1498-N3)-methyltransferase|nr:16S rRNA (uracil(1498)-N(3))-methyltransferase [Microscillaceae bacterium]